MPCLFADISLCSPHFHFSLTYPHVTCFSLDGVLGPSCPFLYALGYRPALCPPSSPPFETCLLSEVCHPPVLFYLNPCMHGSNSFVSLCVFFLVCCLNSLRGAYCPPMVPLFCRLYHSLTDKCTRCAPNFLPEAPPSLKVVRPTPTLSPGLPFLHLLVFDRSRFFNSDAHPGPLPVCAPPSTAFEEFNPNLVFFVPCSSGLVMDTSLLFHPLSFFFSVYVNDIFVSSLNCAYICVH